MSRFVVRRAAIAVPTLLGVTVVVFLTLKLIPGNPVAALAGMNSTAATRAALTHQLGLDRSWPVQYLDWIRNVVRGDFGVSISEQQPVRPLVTRALDHTAILAGAGAVVAVVGGLALGGWSALRRGRPDGNVASGLSALALSAPQYTVALVLLVVLTVDVRMFPSGGMYDADGGGGLAALLRHLVLPAVAVGLAPMGVMARMFRAALSEVMAEDFVAALKARGIRRSKVLLHAVHNTLPSLLTVAGLQMGFLLGGAIFVEILFTWPGIGQLVYQSISSRDYPVIEGCSLVLAVAFVAVNFLVDTGHAWIDPRARS